MTASRDETVPYWHADIDRWFSDEDTHTRAVLALCAAQRGSTTDKERTAEFRAFAPTAVDSLWNIAYELCTYRALIGGGDDGAARLGDLLGAPGPVWDAGLWEQQQEESWHEARRIAQLVASVVDNSRAALRLVTS